MANIEELTEDMIRAELINIVQWVGIRGEHLTPFQRTVRDMAEKYNVPSPFDEDPKPSE